MNQSLLLRVSMVAFAAVTLLPAQAEPTVRARQNAPTADAAGTEKMQVRLAEVIAMLEEDDLTPKQRSAARAKLEEIVAGLQKRAVAPAARSLAQKGREGDVIVVESDGEVAPTAPRVLRGRRSLAEVAAPAAPAAPTAPEIAKAPRAPKAPKAGKGGESMPQVLFVDRDRVEEGARVLREVSSEFARRAAEHAKASQEHNERRTAEVARAGARAAKAQAEAEEVLSRVRSSTGRNMDRVRSTDGVRVLRRAKADEDEDENEHADVPSARARATKKDDADFVEVHGRERGRGADEAELREMIDSMRQEMREIRALMQKMRERIQDEQPMKVRSAAAFGR